MGDLDLPGEDPEASSCWAMGWIDEEKRTLDLLVTIHQCRSRDAVQAVGALVTVLLTTGRVVGLARIVSPCDHKIEAGSTHLLSTEPRPGAVRLGGDKPPPRPIPPRVH